MLDGFDSNCVVVYLWQYYLSNMFGCAAILYKIDILLTYLDRL